MTTTSTLETVTPEIAEKYLSKNVKNRNLKESRIQRYVRDMQSGRWLVTGEALKFDVYGNMIDGQNRCHAVVRSGCHIDTWVVRGLESESQVAMDSGAPRSAADALTFNGVTSSKDVAAVATVHHLWNTGAFPHCMTHYGSGTRMTTSEIAAYVADHPELIEATAFARKSRKVLPLAIGSTAVAYDEFVAIDPDATLDFFSRITDMRMGGKGDPIVTLTKRVNEMRLARTRILPSTGLFLLIRAWNAFRAGEQLQKFQFGSKEHGWVEIPEPK